MIDARTVALESQLRLVAPVQRRLQPSLPIARWPPVCFAHVLACARGAEREQNWNKPFDSLPKVSPPKIAANCLGASKWCPLLQLRVAEKERELLSLWQPHSETFACVGAQQVSA